MSETCERCAHCEEVMGDEARCELNMLQIAQPIPDECVHYEGKPEEPDDGR